MKSRWIDVHKIGPSIRIAVRCYKCGHQALVGLPEKAKIPQFGCGECLNLAPIIEVK